MQYDQQHQTLQNFSICSSFLCLILFCFMRDEYSIYTQRKNLLINIQTYVDELLADTMLPVCGLYGRFNIRHPIISM